MVLLVQIFPLWFQWNCYNLLGRTLHLHNVKNQIMGLSFKKAKSCLLCQAQGIMSGIVGWSYAEALGKESFYS